MGPKKKRPRGKKKRSKKGRKKPKGITNVEKELYEITIKTLTERLERREALIEELKRLKEEYKSKHDNMASDRSDVIEYLESEVQEKKDEIDVLRLELIKLEELRQMDRVKSQEEAKKLRQELGNHINFLQQENEVLGEKLSALEEFRVKKEEIEAHVADLENDLREKTEHYDSELYKLEKLGIIDHDCLRKEMIRRVELAAEACRKFSEDHMHSTVKRAVVERIRMGVELKRTGDTAYKLSEENENLKTRKSDLKLELKISHDCENEMSVRYQSQHEDLRTLKQKCAIHERDQEIIDSLEKENKGLGHTVEKQKKWLESLNVNASHLTNEVRMLTRNQMKTENEMDKMADMIAGLSTVIQECSRCIKQGITEVPSDEEGQVEYMGKRQMMLLQLIDIMDRAAEMGDTDYGSLLLSQRETSLPVIDPWLVDKPPIQYQRGDVGILPKYEPTPEKLEELMESNIIKVKLPAMPQFHKIASLKPSTKTILSEIGLLTKFERLDRMMHELH